MKTDGRPLWVSLTAYKSPHDANELHTLVMMSDISLQREKAAAAREDDERFRHLIEAARDGIWDWDISSGHVD